MVSCRRTGTPAEPDALDADGERRVAFFDLTTDARIIKHDSLISEEVARRFFCIPNKLIILA